MSGAWRRHPPVRGDHNPGRDDRLSARPRNGGRCGDRPATPGEPSALPACPARRESSTRRTVRRARRHRERARACPFSCAAPAFSRPPESRSAALRARIRDLHRGGRMVGLGDGTRRPRLPRTVWVVRRRYSAADCCVGANSWSGDARRADLQYWMSQPARYPAPCCRTALPGSWPSLRPAGCCPAGVRVGGRDARFAPGPPALIAEPRFAPLLLPGGEYFRYHQPELHR
jgi:hypothetical protein